MYRSFHESGLFNLNNLFQETDWNFVDNNHYHIKEGFALFMHIIAAALEFCFSEKTKISIRTYSKLN